MLRNFLSELRHRKVLRTSLGYAVFAFAAVEAVDVVTPVFGLPEGALVTAIIVALAGFPVVAVLAWHLDLTADGVTAGTPAPDPARPSAQPTHVLSWLLVAILTAAVAYLSYRLVSETRPAGGSVAATQSGTTLRHGKSIAVLPFARIGGQDSADSAYFSDGVAQEILTALSGISGLRVAARSSSFAFRGENLDVTAIGDALNVSVLLEGSVRRAGEQLRVTAELVDTATGFQLWADVFDYGRLDVFRVQEEIARSVVSALELELGVEGDDPVVRPGTENIAAYDLYLQGRHLLQVGRPEQSHEAVAAFEQAIELDPNYAQAHAGLADAWISIREIGNLPLFVATQKSHDAITEALRINSQLPEAQTSLGLCILGGGNKSDAMQQFDRAISLDPEYVQAHVFRANLFRDRGHLAMATRTYTQALALDPLNLSIVENQALLFAYQGRYDKAMDQLEDLAAEHPGRLSTLLMMNRVAAFAGDYEQALAAAQQARDIASEDPVVLAAQLAALSGLGRLELARDILDEVRVLAPQNETVILATLNYHLLAGEYEALDEHAAQRAAVVIDNPGFQGTDMRYERLAWAGLSRLLLGDAEGARQLLQTAMPEPDKMEPTATSVRNLALLARAHVLTLDDAGATAVVESARLIAGKTLVEGLAPSEISYALAAVAAANNEPDVAVGHFVDAINAGWQKVGWAAHDPALASIRETPEYRRLVAAL